MDSNAEHVKRSVLAAIFFLGMALIIRDKASFGLAAGSGLGAIVHWLLRVWRAKRKGASETGADK